MRIQKVSTVKAWLEQECKVPILAQTLMCGTVELENTEKIGVHSGEDQNILCLTMLITWNDAIARLDNGNHDEKLEALEAVAQIAEKGNERAITAVSARLEDRERDVRHAAVRTMAQIAEKGDAHAITAVSARLEDRDEYFRVAAVRAMAQIAEKGNAYAISRECSPRGS